MFVQLHKISQNLLLSNVMHLKTSPNSFFLGISLNIIIVHNLTFTPANSENNSAATYQKLMLFWKIAIASVFETDSVTIQGKSGRNFRSGTVSGKCAAEMSRDVTLSKSISTAYDY